MLKAERRDRILGYLAERSLLAVKDAVRLLDVGELTVRRDFNALAAEGLAERIRGGIRLERQADMQPFGLREVSHGPAKTAIGRRAAGLLQDGDTVFIDGGTTTYQVADFLPNCRLRVITNSLRLAARLESRLHVLPKLELFVTGGLLHPNSGLLVGPGARQSLEQYHADWAFLSAGGVNAQGIFNTNEPVVDSERVMIAQAEKVVVMADHSKIGRHAMCHVCKLDAIDMILTDADEANEVMLQQISDEGIQVIRVATRG